MPRPLILESFETAQEAPLGPESAAQDSTEEARLEGYETGYKAGWDDATAAGEAEGDDALRGAARNLQAISFTFHEARLHLLDELAPLLDTVCSRVLPEMAADTLGPVVREALMPLLSETLDGAITLRVHPGARAGLEAALEGEAGVPAEIVDDPALGPAEVHISGRGEERHIDLDAAIARVRSAVQAFFEAATRPPDTATDPQDPSAPPQQEMLRHG